MTSEFKPNEIERAAQAAWQQADAYRVTEDASRRKFYACSMLPYPSGKLHMGHVRNYTINDMLTRQLRMKGLNVLMPMGWDAFGLPAENAAIKNKVPPAQWTYDNIAYMKQQMQSLGLAIDWSREVATCSPDYYKWNQWLFLKMLNAGIAQRRTQVVNWDPVDQTVLANEQVIDGRGWRSGALVEKREIPGYYLNITQYAPELLDFVQNQLGGWPERVRLMQENWIGKSEGVRFAFTHEITHEIAGVDGGLIQDGKLYVFTTRADTVMGVTFCAVAAEHPLALQAAASTPGVATFLAECKTSGTTEAELATQEKKGVDTGLLVTHPLTGEMVPVWVGNYVLMSYGDGAVMGVPAHDERDFAFARKYKLPIKPVVIPPNHSLAPDVAVSMLNMTGLRWHGEAPLIPPVIQNHPAPGQATLLMNWHGEWQTAFAEKGMLFDSGTYTGLTSKEAVNAIAADLAAKNLGAKKTTWRLRDWGISRQRYWGTPIPIIHCPEHGAVPVPEQDLPVVLPQDLIPDGSGNPLSKHAAFLNVACPTCGQPARRETDTMDTFVDSSWYFLRYCDPKNENSMVSPEAAAYWMPMDQYIGGIEHAILHLLYARFWTKVMRDLKLIQVDEPFTKLLTQGMVLNEAFVQTGADGGRNYQWAHELDVVRDEHMNVVSAHTKQGAPVQYEGWTTMSKSKNNGVDPQALIAKYGADTARLFVMFASPPEQTLEWNDAGVEGAHRFLRRVWSFGVKLANVTASNSPLSADDKALRFEVHTLLRQISYDYERMQYNTVISGSMKLLNALEACKAGEAKTVSECYGILLRVLYPACPHTTWQLWQQLGFSKMHGDLLDAPWPLVDEAALVQDEIELMLQINGKLRGSLRVAAGADKAAIEAAALGSAEFLKFAEGQPAKKVIVVPGRLVNVVVNVDV
jgi:leucyl-tRNA synthetase